MKLLNKKSIKIIYTFTTLLFASCSSLQVSIQGDFSVNPQKEYVQTKKCSYKIQDKGKLNEDQLVNFFMENQPDANKAQVKRLARYYIQEAADEEINSDLAFAQMCLETGFLKFGNLVKPEMFNFCGLGAMDQNHPGEFFPTEQLGVRAHIQHLHAYGTTENVKLKKPLIDPRYKYVNPRGKALTVLDLSGKWATDKSYGQKIQKFLDRMSSQL